MENNITSLPKNWKEILETDNENRKGYDTESCKFYYDKDNLKAIEVFSEVLKLKQNKK